MASSSTEKTDVPKCRMKGCMKERYTKIPLGPLVYCKTHFNALLSDQGVASLCRWRMGCDKQEATYGTLKLRYCTNHIEYTLTTLSIKKLSALQKPPAGRVSNDCCYTYREARYGYKAGTECKQPRPAESPYCSLHRGEMIAVSSCLEMLLERFAPYFSSVLKAPKLKVGNREEYCRTLFKKHTGHEFPRSRPSWLKQERTGKSLELDGYCEALAIAFEHDGEHHYTWPNTFHKTKQDYNEQRDRDSIKDGVCARRGVLLIRIRQDVPAEDLETFIKKALDAYQTQKLASL